MSDTILEDRDSWLIAVTRRFSWLLVCVKPIICHLNAYAALMTNTLQAQFL